MHDGDTIEFSSVSSETSDVIFNLLQVNKEHPEYLKYVFDKITSDKYNTDELPAGIIHTIIYLSLKLSGVVRSINDIADNIDKNRESVKNNVYYTLFSSIIKAMPSYTLDELKLKTTNEIFELIAFSEKILDKQIYDTSKIRTISENNASSSENKEKRLINNISNEEIDEIKNLISRQEFLSNI